LSHSTLGGQGRVAIYIDLCETQLRLSVVFSPMQIALRSCSVKAPVNVARTMVAMSSLITGGAISKLMMSLLKFPVLQDPIKTISGKLYKRDHTGLFYLP